MATVGLALLAGAGVPVAVLLGLAMFALQASIGTLNDIVDAERDRGSKLAKPIPLGLVPLGVARSIAAGSLVVGLVLSAAARPLLVIVAGLGIGLGYAYDLRLKAGPWSWLPFALGVGLLPVFAWLGATGRLPAVFGVVLPAAILAGAGLALANQLADVERDRQAGLQTTVARLGRARAWRLSAVLELIAATLAMGSLAHAGAGIEWLGAAVVSIGLASTGRRFVGNG
ncbi:MAG: UbiA family prenyltransferase [Candidatus Limnocylindrales bacterium]